MKEFDALLNEVLHQDANLEPSAGLERRIASALSSEGKRLLDKRRFWREAIAATILLGLAATWALKRSQPIVPLLPRPGSAVEPRPVAAAPQSLALLTQSSTGTLLARASMPRNRPRRRFQRKTVQLAPLEIEPLVIKPIEIASLTSSTSTGKGEVR